MTVIIECISWLINVIDNGGNLKLTDSYLVILFILFFFIISNTDLTAKRRINISLCPCLYRVDLRAFVK